MRTDEEKEMLIVLSRGAVPLRAPKVTIEKKKVVKLAKRRP